MGVLKIKILGQRVKYETAKVTFAESEKTSGPARIG